MYYYMCRRVIGIHLFVCVCVCVRVSSSLIPRLSPSRAYMYIDPLTFAPVENKRGLGLGLTLTQVQRCGGGRTWGRGYVSVCVCVCIRGCMCVSRNAMKLDTQDQKQHIQKTQGLILGPQCFLGSSGSLYVNITVITES